MAAGDEQITCGSCRDHLGLPVVNSIWDLAEEIGLGLKGEEAELVVRSIAKRLFKDTECGISFSSTCEGVTVAGYAEGSDAELPGHTLEYPFPPDHFWEAVKVADQEGCEEWERANESDD